MVDKKMTKTIPSLDGLRAMSFFIVFVAHAGLGAYVPGGLGVTIFFFLSGFLITTLMRIEYERHGTVNLKRFWLRRILRIWPAFYLVLLAAITAALVFQPDTLSMPAARAQLLHLSNYWSIYHGFVGQADGTGVYWSLAVEEHFYVLLPVPSLSFQAKNAEPLYDHSVAVCSSCRRLSRSAGFHFALRSVGLHDAFAHG